MAGVQGRAQAPAPAAVQQGAPTPEAQASATAFAELSPALTPLLDVMHSNALQGDGKPPFHLKMSADVYDTLGKPQEKADIEYWWGGPAGFLLNVSAPSIGTVHTMRTGEIASERGKRTLYLLNQLLEQTRAPAILLRRGDVKLVTVAEKHDQLALECMHIAPANAPPDLPVSTALCTDPTGSVRLIRDGAEVVIRNRNGKFGKTQVALDVSVFIGGRLAIHGVVDQLQGFDPAQAQVALEKPAAPPSAGMTSVQLAGSVIAGNAIKKVPPVYPPIARDRRVSGSVLLGVTISPTGDVTDVLVLGSSDPTLEEAAMDSVRQWKYRPYLLNGTPVAVDTVVTLNFNLH